MTTFGQGKLSRTLIVRYLVVDADTSYFTLIGKNTLNELGVVVSTPHLKIKFPTLTREIVTIQVEASPIMLCHQSESGPISTNIEDR